MIGSGIGPGVAWEREQAPEAVVMVVIVNRARGRDCCRGLLGEVSSGLRDKV